MSAVEETNFHTAENDDAEVARQSFAGRWGIRAAGALAAAGVLSVYTTAGVYATKIVNRISRDPAIYGPVTAAAASLLVGGIYVGVRLLTDNNGWVSEEFANKTITIETDGEPCVLTNRQVLLSIEQHFAQFPAPAASDLGQQGILPVEVQPDMHDLPAPA